MRVRVATPRSGSGMPKSKKRASQSGSSRGLREMPKAMFGLARMCTHKWEKCLLDTCNRWVPMNKRGDKRFHSTKCKAKYNYRKKRGSKYREQEQRPGL